MILLFGSLRDISFGRIVEYGSNTRISQSRDGRRHISSILPSTEVTEEGPPQDSVGDCAAQVLVGHIHQILCVLHEDLTSAELEHHIGSQQL